MPQRAGRGELGIAAVAGWFGRDVDADLVRIEAILEDAAEAGARLVVLPDAAIGGYLPGLDGAPGRDEADGRDRPPALDPEGPEIKRLMAAAGDLVVCAGYCEAGSDGRYNAAVCVTGDGVLGRHRKLHQPSGETAAYDPGDRLEAFDTPVGRIGMLIDYDKTFPEAARALAGQGADVLAFLSAWPASLTNRAPRLAIDRQTRLFDLYDCVRAAENQVVVASANQTGTFGRLRFLGRAKVVGPGGEILTQTSTKAGLALARLDVDAVISRARANLHHLAERRPDVYATASPLSSPGGRR